MKTVKVKNALRAVLTAWALFMDLNLRSGNNYVNLGESLTGTSGAVALAAMAGFLALEWADEKLTRSSGRVKLAALMMGAWQVVAVSVSNTDSLNQPFLSGSQTLKAVVLALGMASLFELLFRLLEAGLDGRLDVRPAKNGALLSAYRAHTMLFCTAVVLLCWLPHLAVSYPVAMNSDTASQFRQALGWEPWNADHPTFGTALIKLCIGAGRLLGSGNLGVFLYILAQAVFGAAVVGYSQMLMRRLCAPVWLMALSLAVCALGTVYCDNITVILKDVPYSYAMLLMLCEMVRVRYLEDASYFGSRGFVLRMMLAGFVLLKIRNNGLLIWIPAGIALICRAVKSRRRAAVGAVCTAVVLPMLLGAGFDAAVARSVEPIENSPKEMLSLPFQQTARFVSEYESEITDEKRAVIDRVLIYDQLADRYRPDLSDPVKAVYRKESTAAERIAYLKVWVGLALRHPACCLSATLIQNALLFDVSSYNLAWFVGTGLSEEEEAALDIHRSEGLEKLEAAEANLRTAALTLPFALQLNTLGFYCAVLLGACAIARSRRARGMGMLLLPLTVTLFFLPFGPCIANQDRYGFPIIYLMPLALAALAHALQQKKTL